MTPIYLSKAEKETLTRWLSRRAAVGGWFMLAMVAGLALLMGFVIITTEVEGQRPFPLTAEDISPIITLLLAFILPGLWLLRRHRAIRRLFDEPLFTSNGRILSKYVTPYMGWRITIEIHNFDGDLMRAGIGYLGNANWEVGDSIELIFWQNGRFCPRHLTHIADLAYLPTPTRRKQVRKRAITAVLIWLLLALMGIFLGLYGQGRI